MIDYVYLKRLEWRCRRGMLELDLLLKDFVRLHLADLEAEEISMLDKLLNLPDPALWEQIMSKETPQKKLIQKLRGDLHL
jgi:antitoxin CptB